ncbi:MAG: ATP-binding protein [Gemmatimonadota bacterium]
MLLKAIGLICESKVRMEVMTRSSDQVDGKQVLNKLAIGFVIGALALLTVLPTVAGRYVDERRAELTTLTRPARSLVTRVHVSLALAGAALRDYLTTNDSIYLTQYLAARGREQQALRQVRPLLIQLSGRSRSEFLQLEQRSQSWHESVDELLRLTRLGSAVDPTIEENNYKQVLLSGALLDEAITEAADRNEAQIGRAEQTARWVVYGLVLVALIATFVMVRLGLRMLRIAREATASRAELARISESQARLVRGMAHDVKNPLSAIQGYAVVLEEGLRGPMNPEQRRIAGVMQHLVDSAVRTIDSLLDLARIESGTLPLSIRPVDVVSLARVVGDQYRGDLEAKGITLELELPREPLPITSDPDRITQILGNLLSNAGKYSPSGGHVNLCVAREVESGAGLVEGVTVRVSDTGPGIEVADQDKLFEEFTRLPETGAQPGAGVGLAISQQIAHLLGGRITLRSAPGEGAEFRLWLPASTNRPGERRKTAADLGNGRA